MKLIYTGKTKEFTPELEKKVGAKVAKLSKMIEQRGEREAHVTHRLERHLHKVEAPAHRLAQDPRRLRHGLLVSRDVDFPAVQLGVLLEGFQPIGADVLDRDHLQRRIRANPDRELALEHEVFARGHQIVVIALETDRRRRPAELALLLRLAVRLQVRVERGIGGDFRERHKAGTAARTDQILALAFLMPRARRAEVAGEEVVRTEGDERRQSVALMRAEDGIDQGGVSVQRHPRRHAGEEGEALRRAFQERFLAVMLQVEKSHVPFPDEPPVVYPDSAIVRRLTRGQYEHWKDWSKYRIKEYSVATFGSDVPGRLIELRDAAAARALMNDHVKMIRARRVAEHGQAPEEGHSCC